MKNKNWETVVIICTICVIFIMPIFFGVKWLCNKDTKKREDKISQFKQQQQLKIAQEEKDFNELVSILKEKNQTYYYIEVRGYGSTKYSTRIQYFFVTEYKIVDSILYLDKGNTVISSNYIIKNISLESYVYYNFDELKHEYLKK